MSYRLLSPVLAVFLFFATVACVNATEVAVVFRVKDRKSETRSYTLEKRGNVEYLTIPANEIPTGTETFAVHHPWATAKVGEKGFYVFCNGMYGEFRPREKNATYTNGNVTMPIIGVRTPRGAMVAIMTGMRYEASHVAEYKDGVYRIYPRYKLDGEQAYASVGIEFHILKPDAGYPDMAREYRRFQLDRGVCKPLKERIKSSPELKYATESIEIRLRLGWKPVPSPVGEQTAENEPPVHVAITFDRFAKIADECKRQGVRKAEMCLVGWNIGGHDGRYPQIFPVEPKLGTEDDLRRAIERARNDGFQVVCHTSESGAYSVSALGNRWDRDYLLVRKGGKIVSYRTWGGGNVYHTCPQEVFKRFAKEDYDRLKALGFRGLHYIDVYSTVNPRTCYSEKHPLTKEEFGEGARQIMGYAKKELGGVASEGGFDYVLPELDYALYVSFFDPGKSLNEGSNSYVPSSGLPKLIDRHTPFWHLVYNGIVLNNPYTSTANFTVKNRVTQLKLIEFGGRPMFYFYSKFLSKGGSWMGLDDLTCDTDEELVKAVGKIREGYDLFEKLRYLQLEFMDNHETLAENVFKTTFSDGSAIVTNYRDTDYKYEDRTVRAMDWLLIKP